MNYYGQGDRATVVFMYLYSYIDRNGSKWISWAFVNSVQIFVIMRFCKPVGVLLFYILVPASDQAKEYAGVLSKKQGSLEEPEVCQRAAASLVEQREGLVASATGFPIWWKSAKNLIGVGVNDQA